MNIKWSAEDRQFVREHAAHTKDKDLAKELRSGVVVTCLLGQSGN